MNKAIFISIIGVCINLIAMYASLIFYRDTINTKVILHMIPILGFLIGAICGFTSLYSAFKYRELERKEVVRK